MVDVAIIAGYPKSLTTFRANLIETLCKRGHRVHAIAPDAEPEVRDWLAARDVAYHRVDFSRAALSPIGDLKVLLAMRRVLRNLGASHIIAYTIKPVVFG
ncbi:MAG: hypothetical protein KDJ16_11655, partial [Hyphomicrobiales bacterium]|nr:hypothetical protein [Hyphomicrobiales bacterium]